MGGLYVATTISILLWKVSIVVLYTGQWYHSVEKVIKQDVLPTESLPCKVIIYSNARSRLVELVEKLSRYFDSNDTLESCNILSLVGAQTRAQKATTIDTFVNGSSNLPYKYDVLCATSSVGNAGIDCKDVRSVYRVDFPPSITDVNQERGRAGRQNDATHDQYKYQVAIALESFLYIFKRINDLELFFNHCIR